LLFQLKVLLYIPTAAGAADFFFWGILVQRNPWTEAGFRRNETNIADLRRVITSSKVDASNDRGGENSVGEGKQADMASLIPSKGVLEERLRTAQSVAGMICIAEIPRQFRTAQLGHRVEIEYLDTTARRERGDREAQIIGGVGENDNDEILRTISCTSPLGKAIVGREVGETMSVSTMDGDYEFKIISISLPEQETAKIAHVA
jgi:transcription elongation factor GreA